MTLRDRAKKAVGWPLRRIIDPRLDGLLNELTHRQDLSASATQESMEALAVGTRLLRGSVLELADELHGGREGGGGELALLRAAALGAVAASGRPRSALAVGEDMSGELAALGIAPADAAGDDDVDLVVVVALDLPEGIPVERLAAGGTLVLALGPGVSADRAAALTGALTVAASAALAPAGASRVIVARRAQ